MDRLRGAVIDGRTRNIRYRQDELQNLHSALCVNSTNIKNAIVIDSSCSIEVAERVFFLTMDAVRQSYNTLNFDRSLKEEYKVRHGENNLTRSVELGLLVLRPTRHTRFYSVVTPLAAAIAAGNCLILEVRTAIVRFATIERELIFKSSRNRPFRSTKHSKKFLSKR